MSEQPIIYMNGDYVPLSDAKISILDQGFLLGDGVFDVVSAWKGSLYKLDAHIERFFQSLQAAMLNTSMSHEDWRAAIIETLRRNDLQDATVRFIVTRGVSTQVVADPREFEPTIIIWPAPYIFLADEKKRAEGIRLFISHLRAFSPDTLDPRYKCLDRLHFQLAKIEALNAGCDDVLWLTQGGHVGEGPASNLFMVKGGKLFTPGDGVLHGITRLAFMEIAAEAGIPCIEANLTPFDLYSADELFTCSTAGGALAVREIAGRQIQAAVPGPITQELDRRYWEKREAGADGTPIYG
jgi:branched-chain amino acid aminotransferase